MSVEVCPRFARLLSQRPFHREIGQQTEEIAAHNVNQDLNRLRQPNVLPFAVRATAPIAHAGARDVPPTDWIPSLDHRFACRGGAGVMAAAFALRGNGGPWAELATHRGMRRGRSS